MTLEKTTKERIYSFMQKAEQKQPTDEEETPLILKQQIHTINFLVISINDFADRHKMAPSSAYRFLADYGGIDFLLQHYEIEHTLNPDDVVDDLEVICRQGGGVLP